MVRELSVELAMLHLLLIQHLIHWKLLLRRRQLLHGAAVARMTAKQDHGILGEGVGNGCMTYDGSGSCDEWGCLGWTCQSTQSATQPGSDSKTEDGLFSLPGEATGHKTQTGSDLKTQEKMSVWRELKTDSFSTSRILTAV